MDRTALFGRAMRISKNGGGDAEPPNLLIDRANTVWKLVETCDEIRALMAPCLKKQTYFSDFGVYFPQYQPPRND